jgi:hypothetical protein
LATVIALAIAISSTIARPAPRIARMVADTR